MRKLKIDIYLLFSVITLIISGYEKSYCQQINDTIVKHTNEIIEVKIISIENNSIIYSYPNESITQTISLNCVNEIKFSSGRLQKGTQKIEIKGEIDWNKVIITANPDDVKCLVRKGEVTASASNTNNLKSKKQVEEKAMMKFKKEAAKLNCHIILLQDQHKKDVTFWSGASSSKYGVAYSYE
ncbi:MAG: hypothetical protein IT232_06100 [Flavobacteriales bacterium]|nr:hypothetical protein [Flavobacteriales bacterium]